MVSVTHPPHLIEEHIMKKKIVASGLAAGLIAGAGAGLILQSSGFAGASNAPAAVTAAATTGSTTTGTAADTARPDRSTKLTEALQGLVDDNTITEAQRTAVVEAITSSMPARGDGDGDHGKGGRGGRGKGGPSLDVAGFVLGLSADELRTELEAGKTIAQVATEKGVDVQKVIDALVADASTSATERITDIVNNGRPAGGPGRHGDADDDGDAPADAPVTTTAG
jgi:hypothetical protein